MLSSAVLAYLFLVILIILSDYSGSKIFYYLIPLYMFGTPLFLRQKIRFSFNLKELLLTFAASAVVLAPAYAYFSGTKTFHMASTAVVLSQLLFTAIPEELFFRGYLQETLGNNLRGLVVSSAMFALAHLPAFFFFRDPYVLLTFFPSLVMGLLYWKTSNIIPAIIFHFLANVLYNGFMI